MNKISALTFILIGIHAIAGCKKTGNELEQPLETEDRAPVLASMVHKVLAIGSPGRMANDTMVYNYDNAGRLVGIHVNSSFPNTVVPGYSLQYQGDHLSAMNILNYAGEVYLAYNDPVEITEAGEKIKVSLISSLNGSENDTVITTYNFEDTILLSGNVYYRAAGQNPLTNNFEYNYNASGNVTAFVRNGDVEWTVEEWDSNNNLYRTLPKTEYLLFHSGQFAPEVFNYSQRGRNNPTKIRFANGSLMELKYEYNEAGYPTKMRVDGHTSVTYENFYFYAE